jgi:AraC-like DNA-binding protein
MAQRAHRRTIPESFVHLLYDYLQAHGIDPQALLGEPRPPVHHDHPGSFPIELWTTLLQRAAEHLHDPTLGLQLGQHITPRHAGLLGYLLIASSNLEQALQRLDRYQQLIYDVTPMQCRQGADHVDLVWGAEQGRPGNLVDETSITALVQFCRDITGQHLQPLRVQFINPPPADLAPYHDYFGCPVWFDQAETVVRVATAALAYPLRAADPALGEVMERHAETLLAKLPQEQPLIEQLRQIIAACLHLGEPSIDAIAAQLGRSARSLQRDLQASGSSFRKVLNGLRKELALAYLPQPHLSLLDIAMLLGYTEQSAFSRSFRQWSGVAPSEYRQQISLTPDSLPAGRSV